MSHFAKIDDDNIVTQVIVAEQDFINSVEKGILISEEIPAVLDEKEVDELGYPVIITPPKPAVYKSDWIQTSYNTIGGVHHCGGIEYVTEPVEAVDAVLYTDKDIIPEDKEVGDVMIPAVEAVEAVYVEGKSPEDVGKPDGGVALRKNYAGVGYTYDKDKDAFYAPKPYASWTLNEDSCQWEAPVAYPDDDKDYSWDEDSQAWVEVTK